MSEDPLQFNYALKAAYRYAVKYGKAGEFIAAWRAVYTAQTADELRQALAKAKTFVMVGNRVIRDFETLDPAVYLPALISWENSKRS